MSFHKILRRILVSVLLLATYACGSESTAPEPVPTNIEIISAAGLNLRIAETRALHVSILDADGQSIDRTRHNIAVNWSSSDTTVLTVDSIGVIRGVRSGQAGLTVRSGIAQSAVQVTVLTPQARLQSGASVQAVIGVNGGSLTAVGADGKKYVLSIPPAALTDTVTIRLTPLAAVENAPAGTTILAGAHFEPEGLQLRAAATLRVSGVSRGSSGQLSGFTYEGTGDEFQRGLAGFRADTLSIPVTHFSGAGAATVPDAATLPTPSVSPQQVQLYLQLDALAKAGQSSGIYDVQGLTDILRAWHATVVVPAFSGAGNSDQQLINALFLFDLWNMVLLCGGDTCPLPGSSALYMWPDAIGLVLQGNLATQSSDTRNLIMFGLEFAIERANNRCIAGRDLQAAANVFYWQRAAERHRVADLSPKLDLATVKAGLCVDVVIVSASFPTTVQPNTPAQLSVTAGLSFNNGPPDPAPALLVEVDATGTTDGFATGFTNAGVFSRAFTPTGSGEVVLNVRVSLIDRGLDEFGVFRDTTVRRGQTITVSITPTAAILDPGAQATFQATVQGTNNTAVTWAATGGTFTTNGNTLTYTAGNNPGSYTVIARSVANPSRSASARVDIFASTFYFRDFTTGPAGPEWSSTQVSTSPSGERFLGEFGNASTVLSLNSLPAHTQLMLEFDIYIIDSWNGNGGQGTAPDIIEISVVGGSILKRTTFSNRTRDVQAFPGDYPGGVNPAGTGSLARDALGYPLSNDGFGDTSYRLRFTFNHTGGTISLRFASQQSSGQNERWGIDNVRVSVVP